MNNTLTHIKKRYTLSSNSYLYAADVFQKNLQDLDADLFVKRFYYLNTKTYFELEYISESSKGIFDSGCFNEYIIAFVIEISFVVKLLAFKTKYRNVVRKKFQIKFIFHRRGW